MDSKSKKVEGGVANSETVNKMDPSKVVNTIYIKEEIMIRGQQITDDPAEVFETGTDEPETKKFHGDNKDKKSLEENDSDLEYPDPEVLYNYYEAWREFKKMQRPKKKKFKMVEIFRDENYSNDGGFSDEEEFRYDC